MAQIDPEGLRRAMDLAPMTNTQLSTAAGISLQYVSDMLAGRRTLVRNPALRAHIARTLGVPTFWIERPPSAIEAPYAPGEFDDEDDAATPAEEADPTPEQVSP